MEKRRIAILGSTGSIGRQTLDVISEHLDIFEVEMLTANNNADLLIEQSLKFAPNCSIICNKCLYGKVSEGLEQTDVKVFAGIESVNDYLKSSNIDIVVAAMVGFSGLEPTLTAIKSGKAIALANKETLVAAGAIVTKTAMECNVPLLPVDSEHSAIFQCLAGEHSGVEKIILTASGGPFRDYTSRQLEKVTKEQALMHPNWSMGAKVTIDSASMMNKGMEMIEASWLFNMPADKIEIVVHPQSIIHSMVQFSDGAVKAQLGAPDMRLPIQYALSYPIRIPLSTERINFSGIGQLTFFAPDIEKFPALGLAYEAYKKGGNMPCIMNAANEVAVEAFLKEELSFCKIPVLIERTMNRAGYLSSPSIEQIFETDNEAKLLAKEILNTI
jgi:1-deoxy-D-xylulose-5-phosphate reductoisomerase